MPKEADKIAAVLEAEAPAKPTTPTPQDIPSPAPITELEEKDDAPLPSHGTVAELISARRKQAKEGAVEHTDEEKERKLDAVDKKLQEMLFKGKPKKGKEEPAKENVEAIEVPEKPVVEARPTPAKAPAKRAPAKDRATELREQELELDRQRLALEKERLELEKNRNKQGDLTIKDDAVLELLSPDERYELEVYQVMGGDLPKKFLETARSTAKYKAQWEKEHTGEVFNPDDSEHDSFFSSNQLKYDKKEFKKAELKLATQGQDDPKYRELEKSNIELKAKSKLQDLAPQVSNTWAKYADAMMEAVDPEIAKLARNGRNPKEAADAILKEYPEEGRDIIMAAEALGALAHEAFKILEGDGLFVPDESGNRVHGQILNIIRRQEQLIPRLPQEERLDKDGRDFATWEQWLSKTPQQQADFWHLGAEEVVDIASRQLAGRVKYEIERAMKIAESRQKRSKPAAEIPEVKEKPPEKRSPSASPGGASKTIVDTPAKPATPEVDKFTKIIRQGLFKRAS